MQHGMESIVYAVDWNQIRENVFAGAAWLGGSGSGGTEVIEQLRKPTALVCSARGAEKSPLAGGRKKRDDILLDLIRSAIKRGGTVLIPTDSSARVLELAFVLDHAWRRDPGDLLNDQSLRKAKLYMASKSAGATTRHVRSMLEWMDENVVKEFESEATDSSHRQHKRNDSKQGSNVNSTNRDQSNGMASSSPFEFKFMKLVETKKKLNKILASDGPKVILASDSSLEWGFSKDVLERIAGNPSSLLILTDDADAFGKHVVPHKSMVNVLQQWYVERKDGLDEGLASDGSQLEISITRNRSFEMTNAHRVPLEGKELLIYQQYLATRKQSQNLSQGNTGTDLGASNDAVDEASSASSSSSEEDDPERQGKALNVSLKTARFNRGKTEPGKEILGVNVIVRQPGVFDFDVRGKKGRDQMFPFPNKRRRADDFGELIKPEDYLRAEEKDDLNGQDVVENGHSQREGLGQKRKWQDARINNDGKINGEMPNKRRHARKTAINASNASVNGIQSHLEISSSEESDDNETEGAVTTPSKLQSTKTSVAANLKIAHVDFSGLHDQRSLTMLIPLIQPKKLILIGGNPSETAYLANDCRQKLGLYSKSDSGDNGSFIFTPSTGQIVNASVDTNAWTVKLSESLVRRFHWQKVRNLGVATLMGLLSTAHASEAAEDEVTRKRIKISMEDGEENKPGDLPTASKEGLDPMPMLDLLPSTMAAATRIVAQPLHVGDLRLADLRKVLHSSGHTAEFRGEGTLLIDGLVAVRKSGNGKIGVESIGREQTDARFRGLDGSFHVVKRKIYECLAVIAGD